MENTTESILQLKKTLGSNVCIMGHHYQDDKVIRHCHITGDSLELARKITNIDAKHIVFCGVYFMAESAGLLAKPQQQVYLPENAANCMMSKMTPSTLLKNVLEKLNANGRKVIPLAYVNTSLAVKAVVGRFHGAVCTSANAKIMLSWALQQGDAVLFLPDKHLARNTAKQLGLSPSDWHILDIRNKGAQIDLDAANKSSLIIWPGCCAIHAKFKTEYIPQMRAEYPNCKIIVHPECDPDLVDLADSVGSTSFIIKEVQNAAPNSTIIIGTETNLVERLRHNFKDNCNVIRLRRAFCSHMAKTTEEKLLNTLIAISNNDCKPVIIPTAHKKPAYNTLNRMLLTCSKVGDIKF